MNCISRFKLNALLPLSIASCAACGAPVPEQALPEDPSHYRIEYTVTALRGNATVGVSLKVSQAKSLLRELTMRPDSRVTGFDADGDLEVSNGEVRWRPPPSGGTLSWEVNIAHVRNGGGYDAWLGTDWGVFRAEDIVPRASTRTLKGAESETHLQFVLPRGWSVVTEYFGTDGRYRIDNPERRFDQPSGWIVAGELGVRRERIAGIRVAVAGPKRSSVRRMDTLAMLNWTLPELARLLPEMPKRVTVVSAGDPMWRGGLSAPQSLFVHADRPLISENGTSTLLHEIMHISLRLKATDGFDWIIEGLAEYYSLEILRRSGTISDSRYATARAGLSEWAESATALCQQTSKGATTALAVGKFAALDQEIRDKSGGEASLDDLVRTLSGSGTSVDVNILVDIADSLSGAKVSTLHMDNLPGCRSISAGNHQT